MVKPDSRPACRPGLDAVRITNLQGLPPLLRESQIVPDLIKVSASTFRRWVRQGTFPQPTRLGGIKFWSAEQVLEFLARRFRDTP